MISGSGLIEHYQKDKADRGEARVENLDELVSAARGFTPEANDLPPLRVFLAHAVLESGEGQGEAWEDCVQMMTLHTAKGLEFPLVFLCGMEDGPVSAPALAQRSGRARGGAAAVLRRHDARHAAAVFHLCRAAPPARRGQLQAPSRFIQEVPPAMIEEVRPRVAGGAPASPWRRFRAERPADESPAACAWARACATASSARAWC